MPEIVFHIMAGGALILLWYQFGIRLRKRAGQRVLADRVLATSDASFSVPSLVVELLGLDREKPQWLHGRPEIHDYLELLLQRADSSLTVLNFLSLSAAAAVLGAYFLFSLSAPPLVLGIAGVTAGLLPFTLLCAAAAKRKDRFLKQLNMAIDVLRSSLLSGHSVIVAAQAVSEEMPDPCGREFKEIMRRMSLGVSLSAAMRQTARKFPSFELEFICCAIDIHQETGGNLAGVLEKANYTLRERLKLREKIEAITAHSQLTSIVLGVMPVAIFVGFKIFNPHYLAPLFDTQIGNKLLMLATIMHISGVALAFYLSQPADR
jgi:tight adherence protein B